MRWPALCALPVPTPNNGISKGRRALQHFGINPPLEKNGWKKITSEPELIEERIRVRSRRDHGTMAQSEPAISCRWKSVLLERLDYH
jgi:hypothetical protein